MNNIEKEEIVSLTRQYGGQWNLNHTNRLLKLVDLISAGVVYDPEVVWTAAHLHDWGAYEPWVQPGVDHSIRSAEVAQEFLAQRGCPDEFIQAVVECILTHHQYAPNRRSEAILLSDADALDFLGAFGALREFARNFRELGKAYQNATRRMETLPAMLCLEPARQIAAARAEEMKQVLERFEEESFGLY